MNEGEPFFNIRPNVSFYTAKFKSIAVKFVLSWYYRTVMPH